MTYFENNLETDSRHEPVNVIVDIMYSKLATLTTTIEVNTLAIHHKKGTSWNKRF